MERVTSARRAPALVRAASWIALAAGVVAPAAAQQAPVVAPVSAGPAANAAGDVQAFAAAYFKTYNPVTAADMVARVPGFEVRDGDDRRGFGATAGNVLINGERPSSKTLTSEQLKRIPADAVLRLELISGSSSSVDVHGQSQLVNVVLLKASAANSPTTFVAGLRHVQYSDRISWTLQASRSLALADNLELAFDLQAPNLRGRGVNFEAVRDASGALTAYRDQYGQPNNIGLQGAATLKWRPDARDSVNINLQYAPTWNTTTNDSIERSANGTLRSVLAGATDYDNNYTGEIGADWERRFSPTFSAKLIGLATFTSVDQHDQFDIFTAPATFTTRTQDRGTEGGERVARLQLTSRALPGQMIEFGAEGAFNYRDTTLDIFSGSQGAVLARVPLAVSNARVEETRGEAFVTDIWSATRRLTIEAGFNFEASQIKQTGDRRQERAFNYPKPHFIATYAIDRGNQLRASLQRDVAQLDFAEFSSTVDFVNAASTQGNPDLVPEKAWKARAEWETHFGKRGALTLAVFHDEVEDVHDLIVIPAAGGAPASDAYGNIGDGSRTGVEIKAALPLGFIGLPTAELRFNGLHQDTDVVDPLTGRKRSFSVSPERQGSPSGSPTLNAGNKDWAYVVNFRQELSSFQSAWGGALVQWSGRREYKRTELIDYDRAEPRLDLYVETTALKPVTVRFNVNNIFSPNEERTRTFFQGDRSSGVLLRTETRRAKGGPEGTRTIGVQVSGKF
jgi:hypothetical protein